MSKTTIDNMGMPEFSPFHGMGNVDLNSLKFNLALTPAQRIQKHYYARTAVERIGQIAREQIGSSSENGTISTTGCKMKIADGVCLLLDELFRRRRLRASPFGSRLAKGRISEWHMPVT